MMKFVDIGLVILIIVAFILLVLIIFNGNSVSGNSSEPFSESATIHGESQQYVNMITANADPIMLDSSKHVSDAGKFLSIPDGLKINMEDIIKMSPVKQNKYLEDSLFADVLTYTNDDVDNQHMTADNLGLGKCLKNPACESCVEFGVTGIAMCFPKK